MRFMSIVSVVPAIAVSAGIALAQEPPALTYYRLDEPNDSSASRAHTVVVDDSNMILVGGEARLDGLMRAYVQAFMRNGDGWVGQPLCLLPTPDSTLASVVFDCVASRPDMGIYSPLLAGSHGDRPVAWHDGTDNDVLDYQYVLLPGTGTVRGIAVNPGNSPAVCAVGESGGDAGAWVADSAQGPYVQDILLEGGVLDSSWARDVVTRYYVIADDGLLSDNAVIDGDDGTFLVGGGERRCAVPMRCYTSSRRWLMTPEGTWKHLKWYVGCRVFWLRGINALAWEPGCEVAAGWHGDGQGGPQYGALSIKVQGSTCDFQTLPRLDGRCDGEALGVDLVGGDGTCMVVGYSECSYEGDHAATLWKRESNGSTTVHNLNDLVVNTGSLDLYLEIAAAVDIGGSESQTVVAGWGVETGGMGSLSSSDDTHAFLLIEEPTAFSTGVKDPTNVSVNLVASPNPSSSGVRISYALPYSAEVRLTVHDVVGRCVITLADGLQKAGEYSHFWSGVSPQAMRSEPGVYFISLEACGFSVREKLVLVR
jgi:hypothetical protein